MSRTALYWFSGTGNSLALARMLAEHLDDPALTPVVQALRHPPDPADVVGVVFPVYWFGLPNIVDRFLREVPLEPDPYVFTVATMGMAPGSPHWQAQRALQSRGAALAAGWSIQMPENYSPMTSEHSQKNIEKLCETAGTKMAEIGRKVKERVRQDGADSPPPLNLLGRALHRKMAPRFPEADEAFVAEAHCTSCGTCVEVCPVNDVELDEEGHPRWKGRCEQCFACLQWCPVRAIHTERVINNRRRYHHPEVSVDDLIVSTAGEETEDTASLASDNS